jgi:hypothetical protein
MVNRQSCLAGNTLQRKLYQTARHHLVLESLELAFRAGLIPIFHPLAGANAPGILPKGSALLFVTSLLHAKKPLVVPIPAVPRLVLGGEPLITRSGTGISNLMQDILLLFRKLGNLRCKNLSKQKREYRLHDQGERSQTIKS